MPRKSFKIKKRDFQLKFEFPGLAKEVKHLIFRFQLPNITNKDVNNTWSKLKWKKKVKEVIRKACESDLQQKISQMKKLEKSEMDKENFKRKEYLESMDLHNARIKFKMRTEMLNFKFNYKSDPKNSACLWKCDSCQSAIETQDHILWCPAYSELRKDKDLKNDEDVIEYFKTVMKIRDKLKITK